MLHILPSSCKDSWKAGSARSEISARTYVISKSRTGRGGLEAHAVQILDEPCQIVILQSCKNAPILVSAKEATELLVKPRRFSLEVAKRLQGILQDHEGG